MIRYSLKCDAGHHFEGWFRNSDSFDAQVESGDVPCPECGSVKVSKALMAPSVRSTKGKDLAAPAPQDSAGQAPVPAESQQPEIRRPEAQTPQSMHAMAQAVELKRQLLALRRKVEENCDYVGDKFADKAREIASGESDAIGIYGEATADEAEALRDEGIEFGQIPWVKEDA